MERPDNSLLAFSTSTGSNNRFDELRKRLFFLQSKRIDVCIFKVTGKDRGRDCWHLLLVDWDKKQELSEVNGGSIDAKNYGKILDSGWSHVMPESANNKANTFIEVLKNQLFIFQLQENNEIYYVLCDADKRSEIAFSKTAEEVGRCAKILYSSMYEDPLEALWDVIEKGYFRSTKGINYVMVAKKCRKAFEIARRADISELRNFLGETGNVDWSDENGWTMLHHAAHIGDPNMIRTLKGMNANTQVQDNICGRKPIHIAAREGHTRAVELFLIDSDSVNDTDRNGWSPLHYAAWKGESHTVEYLISKNANTEIRDKCLGKQPIHVAVTEGHMNIVQIFLDKGADIDDADAEGRTLFYHSILAGRLEMAKFLIDRHANIDIANKFGTKPIHVTADDDHLQGVELLLRHGSDIESRDTAGMTPLHRAAIYGSIKVVQVLVEKGANLSVINDKGETPYDLAILKERLETASYLAEKMCEMFQYKAKCNDALDIYDKLFKFQKKKLSEDHFSTLKTQTHIASILYELGQYEEALVHLNVILNKREVILGSHHLDTLCTKYEMGRVYVAQWKLDKAMNIFKDVYVSWQGKLGPDHPRTLSVAREMAFVHFKNCEYDEAFKVFEDIYEKRKLLPDVNDSVKMQDLQNVAIVLINQGKNKDALRILQDIFEKRKECLGANHPDTLSTSHHITEVEKRLKKSTEEGGCCLM